MINNDAFIEKEIPQFNPLTQKAERVRYWREFKRRCMEGYWVGGKWMPGELYWYINAWHIEVASKDRKNAGKIIGRPWFRDLEWEKAYIATEAFGFSGFAGDTEKTCFYKYAPENIKDYIQLGEITPEQARRIKYIKPRDYIRMNHGRDLGKPLYLNPAKNVIDVEARGGGKSFFASGLIGHNFLLDGSHDYDEYIRLKKNKTPMVSQTLVGAIQASYSSDLLNKFKSGLKYLPGAYTFLDQDFPSPLAVTTSGTLQPGEKSFVSKTGSQIHHRTFQDKAYAANGTRPSKTFLEEIGFFHRLIEALGPMKDLTYDGDFKFGTIWMFGTGGDMEGGSTLAAQEVFYNPEAYDCLVFEDEWEGRGKIGYFVPAEKAMNGFKEGPNLITNMEKATAFLEKSRAKARKANRPEPYNDELQNRPRKPSEAFLAINDNKFPIKDLELAYITMTEKESQLGSHWTGLWYIDPDSGKVKWRNISDDERRPLRNWPVKPGPHLEGCWEIFQMPKRDHGGEVSYGRYIAGTDPVDDDDYEGSLQSSFIMDLWTETIVAEYTARTYHVEDYWENLRLGLMAYNATCNYESQKKGLYGHFKQKTSLHLLCDQPEILRDLDMARITGDGNKMKGTYATPAINIYGRKLYNIWLKKQAYNKEDGVINATTLRSLGLIQESINYNPQGNFDRVSAIGMLFILHADKLQAMTGSRETINEAAAGLAADPFFTKNYDRYLQKNGRYARTTANNNLRVA